MEALPGTTSSQSTARASPGAAAMVPLARQRRQGLGRPPVRTTVPRPIVVGCPGEAAEADVEASHGRDLAAPARKGPPLPPKPKGTATTTSETPAAASRTPTAACTAPATPTTTTFDVGLDIGIDGAPEVFDGMPMSDQSFFDMMNETVDVDGISLPNAFADENEEVIEVAPTPATKKKWARSLNYSIDEDETLVRAWESVSLDPVVGVNQNTKTYWKRIADYFHRHVKTPSSRTVSSLNHRWSTIQVCCNRWAGCVETVERAPPSGTTFEDRIKLCQTRYMERDPKHKTFVMQHCWSLLQHNEKWKSRNNYCDPLKKVSSKSSLGLEQMHEEDEGEEASPTIRSEAPTNKRPPGRKLEKERIKKEGDHAVFQTAVQEMMVTRKEFECEKKQEKESRWMDIKAMEARKLEIEEKKLRVLGNKESEPRMQDYVHGHLWV